jgi:hypothetical protein
MPLRRALFPPLVGYGCGRAAKGHQIVGSEGTSMETNREDCRHLDWDVERLRGCTIGRQAPTDCPRCKAYDPEPLFDFAEEIAAMDDD